MHRVLAWADHSDVGLPKQVTVLAYLSELGVVQVTSTAREAVITFHSRVFTEIAKSYSLRGTDAGERLSRALDPQHNRLQYTVGHDGSAVHAFRPSVRARTGPVGQSCQPREQV